MGRPSKEAASARADLAFERTTRLVRTGVYRFIRHPLYASLLAATWCAHLKNPEAAASLGLALAASAFLTATAVAEEVENLERFGLDYAAYMRRTRRFIPFVF
jgi:protein-S-isoprenylcysteine O-methyltransferase Ste14